MDSASKKRIAEYVQFLQRGRTMIARFRLPIKEDEAYELLMAAVIAEVQFRYRKFVYNEFIDGQLQQMAKWLTAVTPKFGIVLCGGCGNGKTTMLKALQNLIRRLQIRKPTATTGSLYGAYYGLTIVDALHIAQLCKTNHTKYLELVQDDMLAIDNLGTEPVEVMDYGNIMTPVIDLLTKRYEAQLFTIVTTNLDPKDIRKRYGDRIADRLNEMMAKIVYRNPTYRTDEILTDEMS
jgi:DNA replication protein DnaC